MKWLENPQDDAERLIREGLDRAAQRTGDEIMHRRIWARVSELQQDGVAPRSYARLALATGAIGVLVVAGALSFLHLFPSHDDSSGQLAESRAGATVQTGSSGSSSSGGAQAPAGAESDAPLVSPARAPGNVVATRARERMRVALGGGAEAELAENSAITWDRQSRPSIERGVAKLSVPHQPPGWRFSVTAGPYVITVVGTKFEVDVENSTVGVAVTEGVVEVWRGSRSTRLVAGDAWNGPRFPDDAPASPAVAPVPVAAKAEKVTRRVPAGNLTSNRARPVETAAGIEAIAPAPPRAPSAALANRSLEEAQSALQSGDTSRALEILSRAAQGSGPAAENAAYEMGRITRYNLNRPRQAVALWDKYRTRFPAGLLRTEADLSIVETLSQLGDSQAALNEADAFLARHPTSERRAEVQRLAERLRAGMMK
jgi:tetratricopeptide (TPR) repeat protein